jgi:hypothetical protein
MAYSLSMYLVAPGVLHTPARLWLRAMLVFALTAGMGVAYWGLRWM